MLPSYPERARAVVATATGLEVGVLTMTVPLERHVADEDGSILLCAPRAGSGEPGSPLVAAGRLPGPVLTACLTDVAGVPQPDRVRGRVRLTGSLSVEPGPLAPGLAAHLGAGPGRPVLRLRPRRVALDWRVGPQRAGWQCIDPAAYASATPDPLAGWESAWTAHLDGQPGVGSPCACTTPRAGPSRTCTCPWPGRCAVAATPGRRCRSWCRPASVRTGRSTTPRDDTIAG